MIASLDDIQPDPSRKPRVTYDHAAIARARARGVSWKQIAAHYGVEVKTVSVSHYYHKNSRASK